MKWYYEMTREAAEELRRRNEGRFTSSELDIIREMSVFLKEELSLNPSDLERNPKVRLGEN